MVLKKYICETCTHMYIQLGPFLSYLSNKYRFVNIYMYSKAYIAA